GLTHRDYAQLIFSGNMKDEATFEKYGYAYGPIRPSAGAKAPVRHLLVNPTCKPEFVRDKTAVFIVRDPRDILISGYYSFGGSHKFSPVAEIAQIQQRTRTRLNQMTLDEYAIRQAPANLRYVETVLSLASACERGTLLRYED